MNNGINFTVTNTINDIRFDDWQRLFGKDTLEGWGYHKTLEESSIKEFHFGYLIGKNDGKTEAIIPFFISDFSFAVLIQGPLQKFILFVQKIIPRFLKTKILFIGFPTTEELYIGLNDKNNTALLLKTAMKSISELAKNEKTKTTLFFNLSEKDNLLAGNLSQNGYIKMKNYPNCRIALKAASLEEHLSGLSKNTRKDIRHRLNKSAMAENLKTEVLENIDHIKNDIFRLYLNNFNQSDVHFERLTCEFFQNITKNMKGIAKYFITRDQDKIVAFNLCFINQKICIDKFIGFDNTVSKDYQLYYRTFLHNIEWCIKKGISTYQMGITDYHPKIRLGAELVNLDVYFKLNNPLMNFLACPIAKFISPWNFDPTLKNLKRN